MGCSWRKFSRQIEPNDDQSKKIKDSKVNLIYKNLFEEILEKFDEKDQNHFISYCSDLFVDVKNEEILDETDERFHLKEHLRKEIEDENPFVSLGRLMMEMECLDRAKYFYFKCLTKEDQSNWIRSSAVYNNLGKIFHQESQFDKALEFYKKSLQIQREHLDENHRYLTIDYSNIGLIYFQMNQNEKALEYFQKCLSIQMNLSEPNEDLLGTIYTNIGLIYNQTNDHSNALIYHKKSLEMNENSHPSLHPSIGLSHHNLSISFYSLNQYEKSFEHIEKAIEISSSSLPSTHSQCLSHQQFKKQIQKKLFK